MEEIEPLLPRRSRPLAYTICIPIFVFLLNIATFLGIQQQWLILHLCTLDTSRPGNDIPTWDECRAIGNVQAAAAKWGMVLQLCSGIPSLFIGPIFGMISDHIGRKPIILLSMTSGLLTLISYSLVSVFDLGLWVLMVAQTCCGFIGGIMIVLPGTLAYFADVTIPAERSRVFVVGESCFFAAFALGPLLGGYLARVYSSN